MKTEQNINLFEIGKVYAKTKFFETRLTSTRKIVFDAFSSFDKPYLALSGGKDSVAMLGVVDDVAREFGFCFDIWAHVSDASFPGTVETLKKCGEKTGRHVTIDESPVSAFDFVGAQSKQKFGKKGYFFDAIKKQCETHDLAFVGVRAAESKRRATAAKFHGTLFESNVPAHHWKCHPISKWTIQDVAAALVCYGMPIHPIYEKFPVTDRAIRLGYVTAMDLVEKGTVIFLRRNYPEMYIKLVNAKPELRSYS